MDATRALISSRRSLYSRPIEGRKQDSYKVKEALAGLRTDHNFRTIVARNHRLADQTLALVTHLRRCCERGDQVAARVKAQELFETVNLFGDGRLVRGCYQLLMHSQRGRLGSVLDLLEDLESAFESHRLVVPPTAHRSVAPVRTYN